MPGRAARRGTPCHKHIHFSVSLPAPFVDRHVWLSLFRRRPQVCFWPEHQAIASWISAASRLFVRRQARHACISPDTQVVQTDMRTTDRQTQMDRRTGYAGCLATFFSVM